MKPVRVRTAVVAVVSAALVLGVFFQLVVNRGSSLPQHSWWEVGLVALVVAALISSGWRIRQYVGSLASRSPEGEDQSGQPRVSGTDRGLGPRTELPSPETARRTLVLAQAAALGGAVLAGWYLAQIAAHLQRWNAASTRGAVVLLCVLALEGVALSVGGFAVQKWCTLPEDQR